jgi:ElaB/YqjD/DUF883 family membrane-anchored ribosome-binding protein
MDKTASESTTRGFQEQAGRVASEVRELGSTAANSASTLAKDMRDKGAHALEVGKEKATSFGRGFETRVSANPWKSVVIAAGVGALIGFALRRAR